MTYTRKADNLICEVVKSKDLYRRNVYFVDGISYTEKQFKKLFRMNIN